MQKRDPTTIPAAMESEGDSLIRTHLLRIMDYAKANKDKADRSWPVLLKSNTFFNYVTAFIAGTRQTAPPPAASGSPPPRPPARA